MNFLNDSTPRRDTDDLWIWEVPPGWENGRTTFGGLQQAAMIRAMSEDVDPARPLRNLSAVLCGPLVVGRAELRIDRLRAGNKTTAVAVTLTQGGATVTHGFALFGTRRVEDGDWQPADVPAPPTWRDIPIAELPPPLAPAFIGSWALRPVSGFPYAGQETAECSGWSSAREPGGPWDAPHIMAVADSYWPAPLTTLTDFRPFATVTTQTQFLADPTSLDPDQPLFCRATCPAAHGGYTMELREVWSPDGRIVAMNQQSFAIIK